jgi:hypothetical protein
MSKQSLAVFGVMVAIAVGILVAGKLTRPPAPSGAQLAQDLRRHGGDLTVTSRHIFEVALVYSGVRVYPYDARGKPLSSKGLAGKATLTKAGGAPVEQALTVVSEAPAAGFSDHLEAAFDLKALGKASATIAIDVSGLTDSDETTAHLAIALGGQ